MNYLKNQYRLLSKVSDDEIGGVLEELVDKR